jgi:hypothetical protein
MFLIFSIIPGSGLFEREQRQREIGRAGGRRMGEERGERTNILLFNNQRVSTVFSYALRNTVETQWTKLNIGLLL